MTDEQWRPVSGFPAYQVSDRGRVMSSHGRRPRPLKPWRTRMAPYESVTLCADERRRRATIHVLVAEAFIGPRPPGMEVRHLDGDHLNNVLTNLAYGSRSENCQDRVRHGTHHQSRKTHCKRGHPFDEDNTYYKKSSGRSCRQCTREWHRAGYRRSKAAAA